MAAHLAYGIQLSLGTVFLVAVVPKLRRPRAFAETVVRYGVVSAQRSHAIAVLLIAIESFLAFAFLSGWLLGVAVLLAAVTLIVFFGAVAVNLRRGRSIPCGCFGEADEHISGRSLIRLTGLLAAVISVALLAGFSRAPTVTIASLLSDGAAGFAYLVEMAGVAGFLIVAGMWLLNLPELMSVLGVASTGLGGEASEQAEGGG
jgi:hypothetical protein